MENLQLKCESIASEIHTAILAVQSPQSEEATTDSGYRARSRLKSVSGNKDDKICGVCGDKALGCNFDAISCESCKAFFRRNALKEKPTKCLFSGNCSIDVNTRRFCPHCRLQKCLSVGMKRDLILGDSERKKRMQKVMENREKRTSAKNQNVGGASAEEEPDHHDNASIKTPEPVTQPPPSPQVTAATPTIIIAPEQATSALSTGTLATSALPTGTLATSALPTGALATTLSLGTLATSDLPTSTVATSVLSTSTTATLCGSLASHTSDLFILSQLQGKDGESPAELLLSLTQSEGSQMRSLTAEETKLLSELMQVYDLSFTVDLEPLIHIRQLDPSLNQLVNQSSITVLRLIKFAKRLEDFANLPQECQIGILKGCWIHILLLRSVSLYDCMRDVWVTPRGDIPTEILKNATGFVKLHDDHVNYCNSLKTIIGDDLTIVVVLLVIVIFSPDGAHVPARQLVSNIQDKYLILLKHYLESKYAYTRASEMYPQLMAKMKELRELAEVHGKHLLDVNPREIEPIMLEILDLK